jgi:hypothetical protein
MYPAGDHSVPASGRMPKDGGQSLSAPGKRKDSGHNTGPNQ